MEFDYNNKSTESLKAQYSWVLRTISRDTKWHK